MNNIIIVGAGTVGLELMDRLDNTVLIEADPAKYTIARRLHPEWQVIGGDARQPEILMRAGIETAEALVLVTNKDYVNWKVALSAGEFSVRKIVVRIRDEHYRRKLKDAGVNYLFSPVSEVVDAIHREIFPVSETITDIVISQRSPALGSRLGDIKLPGNCIIAAVRRNNTLLKPGAVMALKEGDVLSIVSLGEADLEVFDSLTGDSSPYIPRNRLIFLLLDSDDLRALKEAVFLCRKFKVGCEILLRHRDEKLRHETAAMLKKSGVEIFFRPVIGDILQEFKSRISEFDADSGILAVVHQSKKGHFGHKLPLRYVKSLIESTRITILFARGREYQRVVHLLDSTVIGERCTRCAVSLALDTGSRLYALTPHVSGSPEHDLVRSHTRRMASIFGIEVVEDIIRGNPHIEFIMKVREKPNQLVVVNWQSSFLRRDMLTRIINDAEASVLVVGR